MNDRKKPKISKINDRSLYGKTPLESWVGTVVSYDAQKEQIEGGWGWSCLLYTSPSPRDRG